MTSHLKTITKEKANEMADKITQLRAFVNPLILSMDMEDMDALRAKLRDRHSTIQGGSIIIDACGGDSREKELMSEFQIETFEAIYQYAKHIHASQKIAEKIKEHKGLYEKHKETLKEVFG